jgi:glycine cleavage system transcriptional repressor
MVTISPFALLTAFGQDRPGIVAALTDGLYRLGCNIEDTCMTRLRGEFTMMIMVRLPDTLCAEDLATRLTPAISGLNLTLLCKALPHREAERVSEEDLPLFILSVYGADHLGIVAEVTRVVANHGGNITDVNTRVVGSTEQPVYIMVLEIQLAPGSSPDSLQEALEQLKPTLGVDVTFRPLERVRL